MAFALLSRSRSKPQGSVKPVPKRRSARGQHAADSRFGFAKPVFQPSTTALPTVPVIQAKLKVGEPNDKFEQEADRVAELTGNGNGSILPSAVARSRSPMGSLQRLYGNQAVLQMRHGSGGPPAPSVPLRPSRSGILQRKCACGNPATGRECSECGKKQQLGLQTKLKVNEPGDKYEQEADRVAEQVLAAPVHPAAGVAPSRIQRFAGQSTGQPDLAVATVNSTLACPGRPLEPALRQDMEQRFGHDFSTVRVHSDAPAGQSASDVSAKAYTVGHNIVFGAGQFAPDTHEGRRLIAHELTHVVQQRGIPLHVPGAAAEHRDGGAAATASMAQPVHPSSVGFIQRQPEPEAPTFRDLPLFLGKLELDVGKNLQDYGHHLYQAAILHPDEPEVLENTLARYALGLNVLKTSYRFAGFKPSTADKLALGTGILFKSLTFVREGKFVLDFQVDIGRGVKFETNIDLGVNPKDFTDVQEAGVKFGLVRRF